MIEKTDLALLAKEVAKVMGNNELEKYNRELLEKKKMSFRLLKTLKNRLWCKCLNIFNRRNNIIKSSLMIEKADIALLAKEIAKVMENNELEKYSRELLEKKRVIVSLNSNVASVYKKLQLGSVIDLRYLVLAQLAQQLNEEDGIAGSIAELGVYKGVFAARMRVLFPGRKFYLFDTFEGFDQEQIHYDSEKNWLGRPASTVSSMFRDTSVDSVLKIIEKFGDKDLCIVKKGYFPDSAQDVREKFAFVSIDVDLYQPTLDGLKFFYEHLVPGGYIMVHDCGGSKWMGAGVAVNQFCDEHGIGYALLPDNCVSALITKAKRCV
jgi:hypothetical protein